jgi:hypothetical protein
LHNIEVSLVFIRNLSVRLRSVVSANLQRTRARTRADHAQAFKIIAFGTNFAHRLGYHFGILFALIGVEFVCFPLAMVYERWSMDRSEKKGLREKKEKEEKGEGGEGEEDHGA